MHRNGMGSRWLFFALVFTLAVVGACRVSAQSLAVGVVDYQQIFAQQNGYTAVGMANKLFTEFADAEYKPIIELELGVGLPKQDWERYVTLTNMRLHGAVTDAEKAEQEQLKATAAKLVEEYKGYDETLKKGEMLPDEKQARYKQLRADLDMASSLLTQMDANIRQKTAAEGKRLEEIILANINEAIASVAKTQKLTLVLNRNVRVDGRTVEQVVLWNADSLDVTKRVITQLNSTFKLDMFNAQPANQ